MNQQTELPLLYLMTVKPLQVREPKVEPHRVDLDTACARVQVLVRAAIETPSGGRLKAVQSAILDAHENLLLLNFIESELATPAVI